MMKYFIVCFLAFLSLTSNSQSVSEKPNIIFLFSDDQRDNTFSAMGHPVIKTPHADKLLKNGIRFSNTYIAEPTCSPSRVAILTGMHERINGVGFSSSYQLTEQQWEKTYPALLRNNGYYTGFIGKFGMEYYTFRGKASEKFDYWRAHDGWAKFWAKSMKDYADSEEEIITSVDGESIQRFLNTAPSDKPFCLSVSFSVPHGSQITSMYPEKDKHPFCTIAANENPKLKNNPFYDTLYRTQFIAIPKETATDPYLYIPIRMMDQQKGRANGTYPYDYDTATCREHHIRYYQQISAMDKAIGDMMKTLEQKGLSKNTIIIFASDHGLLMGEYGMGGKGLLYDLTSKIPCFVFDPRQPENRRGITIDKLISSLDITSTILDYAGVSQPKEMQGSSLVPLISGKTDKWREELFLENLFTLRDTPFSEGIVTNTGWKYIRMYDGVAPYNEQHIDFKNRKPEFEQLFNLNKDPAEMHNLINDAGNSKILKELRNKTKTYSIQMNKEREVYKKTYTVKNRS